MDICVSFGLCFWTRGPSLWRVGSLQASLCCLRPLCRFAAWALGCVCSADATAVACFGCHGFLLGILAGSMYGASPGFLGFGYFLSAAPVVALNYWGRSVCLERNFGLEGFSSRLFLSNFVWPLGRPSVPPVCFLVLPLL